MVLSMLTAQQPSCSKVRIVASAHLQDVRAKIVGLKRMEKVLNETVIRCASGTRPECPLLEVLFSD
jgi:MerR family transcriptional regulator, mercuric resistance operon regulatory protein